MPPTTEPQSDGQEDDELLQALEAWYERSVDEMNRHDLAVTAQRAELDRLLQRAEEEGLSITSLAKAMKTSRQHVKRLLARPRRSRGVQ